MSVLPSLANLRRKYQQRRELARYREILSANRTLAGSRSGQTCFIIGNGPSIASQDLRWLASQETFVMNRFWQHPDYRSVRPKYYLGVSAPHGLDPNRPLQLWDQDLPASDPVISAIPETKLFFGVEAHALIAANGWFKSNPIFYLLQQGVMAENLRFNLDPTDPLPFTKNTLLLAMLLAVYMGFEIIYILGCEHDFLAHPGAQAFTDFKHFYPEPAGAIPPEWQSATYENAVIGTLRLFQNYRFLKERLAKTHPQVKIFNATPNSFLDVFPAVDWAQIKW